MAPKNIPILIMSKKWVPQQSNGCHHVPCYIGFVGDIAQCLDKPKCHIAGYISHHVIYPHAEFSH